MSETEIRLNFFDTLQTNNPVINAAEDLWHFEPTSKSRHSAQNGRVFNVINPKEAIQVIDPEDGSRSKFNAIGKNFFRIILISTIIIPIISFIIKIGYRKSLNGKIHLKEEPKESELAKAWSEKLDVSREITRSVETLIKKLPNPTTDVVDTAAIANITPPLKLQNSFSYLIKSAQRLSEESGYSSQKIGAALMDLVNNSSGDTVSQKVIDLATHLKNQDDLLIQLQNRCYSISEDRPNDTIRDSWRNYLQDSPNANEQEFKNKFIAQFPITKPFKIFTRASETYQSNENFPYENKRKIEELFHAGFELVRYYDVDEVLSHCLELADTTKGNPPYIQSNYFGEINDNFLKKAVKKYNNQAKLDWVGTSNNPTKALFAEHITFYPPEKILRDPDHEKQTLYYNKIDELYHTAEKLIDNGYNSEDVMKACGTYSTYIFGKIRDGKAFAITESDLTNQILKMGGNTGSEGWSDALPNNKIKETFLAEFTFSSKNPDKQDFPTQDQLNYKQRVLTLYDMANTLHTNKKCPYSPELIVKGCLSYQKDNPSVLMLDELKKHCFKCYVAEKTGDPKGELALYFDHTDTLPSKEDLVIIDAILNIPTKNQYQSFNKVARDTLPHDIRLLRNYTVANIENLKDDVVRRLAENAEGIHADQVLQRINENPADFFIETILPTITPLTDQKHVDAFKSKVQQIFSDPQKRELVGKILERQVNKTLRTNLEKIGHVKVNHVNYDMSKLFGGFAQQFNTLNHDLREAKFYNPDELATKPMGNGVVNFVEQLHEIKHDPNMKKSLNKLPSGMLLDISANVFSLIKGNEFIMKSIIKRSINGAVKDQMNQFLPDEIPPEILLLNELKDPLATLVASSIPTLMKRHPIWSQLPFIKSVFKYLKRGNINEYQLSLEFTEFMQHFFKTMAEGKEYQNMVDQGLKSMGAPPTESTKPQAPSSIHVGRVVHIIENTPLQAARKLLVPALTGFIPKDNKESKQAAFERDIDVILTSANSDQLEASLRFILRNYISPDASTASLVTFGGVEVNTRAVLTNLITQFRELKDNIDRSPEEFRLQSHGNATWVMTQKFVMTMSRDDMVKKLNEASSKFRFSIFGHEVNFLTEGTIKRAIPLLKEILGSPTLLNLVIPTAFEKGFAQAAEEIEGDSSLPKERKEGFKFLADGAEPLGKLTALILPQILQGDDLEKHARFFDLLFNTDTEDRQRKLAIAYCESLTLIAEHLLETNALQDCADNLIKALARI